MNTPESPFPVGAYIAPSYFCDREKELEWLTRQVVGGAPALLIGIRRLGKTGLIRHLFHNLDASVYHPVFIDLMGTRSLDEMIHRLGNGVVRAFPEKKHEKVWHYIKSLRPSLTFDPLDGQPQIGFNIKDKADSKSTLRSLFSLLNEQSRTVILALDEFQEVAKYPEQAEAIIRTEMQAHPKIRYIFSGSQTHLLLQMFTQGSSPFFGSTQKLYLDKIETAIYAGFIADHFKSNGKDVPESLVGEILKWTDNHTYYTQYVCNQVFLRSGSKVTIDDLRRTQIDIMQTSRIDFYQLKDVLSTGQWKVLVATAKESRLINPTSSKLMQKYALGTPRGVTQAIQTLLNKQYLYQGLTSDNKKFYHLTDIFLQRWIENNF